MAGQLQDKVALITGGCSGIGLGTVELFVAEGANVVVGDVQDEKGAMLEQRFPGRVRFSHCDVTDEADIAKATAAAKEAFGGLDILFNNAGSGGAGSGIAEMTIADWDGTMNLLLRSVVLGMKHAVPLMQRAAAGRSSTPPRSRGWRPAGAPSPIPPPRAR